MSMAMSPDERKVLDEIHQDVKEIKVGQQKTDYVLYGVTGQDGIVAKVERHEKAYWKFAAIIGMIVGAIEVVSWFHK